MAIKLGTVIALIQSMAPKVSPEVIEAAVSDWLDDHPEATTTVEDGSITEEKLASDVLLTLSTLESDVSDVKTAIQGMTTATATDVGKALSPKTVVDGEVTEWKFVECGGSVDPSVIAEAVDDWLDEHPEATTTVEDGSITKAKLDSNLQDFVEDALHQVHDPKTNFINYNDVEEGYIKSDGAAKTSGNWHNTGYVELEAGKSYFSYGLYTGSAGYYAFYADDKSVVSVGTSELPNPFVVPTGAMYGRFSKNGNITSGVWISSENNEPQNYALMDESDLYVLKNQGQENAGKKLEVNNNGVVSLVEDKSIESELWRKGNLYKQSELIQDKYIYKTGNESSYNGYVCTPFLPVSGDYVYVQGFLDTYYAFYNENRVLVASYDTLGDMEQWTPGIMRVAIPANAVYGRFSLNHVPTSYAFISCTPENPLPNDQDTVKDVYPHTMNPNNPCDCESGSVGVFHKGVCIGDSLTWGAFNTDGNETINIPSATTLHEWYSYPTYFTKITGVETTNMGDSSETFKTWYELYGNTDFSGHDFAIIHLGVNDASLDRSDEETEEYLCAIVDALKASVMDIKIYVCTVTPVFSNDRFPNHKRKSQVIRDTLSDHYASDPNVILVDIEQYSYVRQYTSYAAGHFTALGYWRFAKDVANFISWHIDNHMRDYRFVQFIGSDRTYTGD